MISQESFFFCRFHLCVIPGLERLRIDQAVVPLEASCADEGLLARPGMKQRDGQKKNRKESPYAGGRGRRLQAVR